jgi:ferredoxin-NADP reductase
MKESFLSQFDGYAEIREEFETAKKIGADIAYERGMAQDYINRLHPKELSLKVTRVIQETPSAKTLRLVSQDLPLPPFMAGQYVTLVVEAPGIRTGRPLSISSPPTQIAYWDLTVRRAERGLVSNFLLDRVKAGDVFVSSGPAGSFYPNPLVHNGPLVAIAGGSGVTPFMSMIRKVVDLGLDQTIYLFYGNRTSDDVIFHAELTDIAASAKNIHYIPVLEKAPKGFGGHTGYITAEVIKKEIGNVADKTFFLCGPQAMYDFCLPELAKLGVSPRKIKREMYGAPVNISNYPGWPKAVKEGDAFTVSVKGGKTISAQAGVPLLSSLEKNGIVVPFLCRSGECSMCRLKLTKGRVYQPPGTPVRSSDAKYGYVHSCVSYPIEDLEILL